MKASERMFKSAGVEVEQYSRSNEKIEIDL